ncbi:MAG: hypothetical protein FJX72_00450 [Armatimonadetes bacterium]|nr:hypothetical protein [Armatimonadota bacterium]
MIRAAALAACLFVVGSASDLSDRSDGSDKSDRPPIGWCCFFPFVDVGMDQLPKSRASVLSVCSGGWGMGHVEGKVDFGPFDAQLAYAEKHNLKLAIIQEINPFYTPVWLREKVKAAGESAHDPQGSALSIPSISSPLFRAEQEKLLDAFVQHVKERDTTRRVAFYHPGAEWWFPLPERGNPLDVAAFRRWLARKYGSIATLNRVWKSSFAGFDQVDAPRMEMMGGGKGQKGLAQTVDVGHGPQHCSWSAPSAMDAAAKPGQDTYAAVTPGKRYRMSVWVFIESLTGAGVFPEVAWVAPNGGPPVAIEQGRAVRGPVGRWQRLEATFTAPANAGRAWLLLKFMGLGAARYDDIGFVEEGGGPELAPNPAVEGGGAAGPAAWSFQNWTGGAHAKAEWLRTGGRVATIPSPGARDGMVGGGSCLRIEVRLPANLKPSVGNSTAAFHDWSTYWFEAGADYINAMSEMMKKRDPTRPTVTYLTIFWAAPSEWDEMQRSAIAPDVVGMRGKHIDAFGMQLCSADRDPYRVTACLDLMRKYAKPMWAVDLVDFTAGVHIGPNAMDQITQATIQHGAAGIIYCAWHIPSVLDYSYHPYHTTDDHARMIGRAMKGVEAMAGMRVKPHGALIMPMLPATPADQDGVRNDWRSFVGWYKLLERMHYTVDVVTLRELDAGADLKRYPWVVVPDCRDISDAALRSLRSYSAQCGRLIVAGRFAERDDRGRQRPITVRVRRAPDLGRLYAGDPVRDTHAGNTPPLFLWKTDTPVAKAALRRAARSAGVSPATAAVRSAGVAPASGTVPEGVRIVRWGGSGREALYLVNHSDRAARNIRVRLAPGATSSVRVLADLSPAKPIHVTSDRSGLNVTLPEFRVSCIVQATQRRK